MPNETYDQILAVARKEFLEKGYAGASMRSIAEQVGISAAALYWHFKNKEALYAALVEPVLARIRSYAGEKQTHDEACLASADWDTIWGDQTYRFLLDFIYDHFEDMELLVFASTGSTYERMLDNLVEEMAEETLRYLAQARAAGHPVADPDPLELRLFLTAQYDTMLEVVRRHFTREQAEHYFDSHRTFFVAGWRSYLAM
ncbi:MAG: TetR/AcrR family transcriptional regulator [Clostridia bacterium]|nr:TetR/AcrR family transcriptional regulator [Clostridia bacterium]